MTTKPEYPRQAPERQESESGWNRREFLKAATGAAATGSVLALFAPWLYAEEAARDESPSVQPEFNDQERVVFEAIHAHLLPSGTDSPGAADVNATAYLSRFVSHPRTDPVDARFVRRGLGWLQDAANESFGKPFQELAEEEKESTLRALEAGRGSVWLSVVLAYTLEALLGDPAYGGNPDGVGWNWLEHQPGFPRPTPDKIFGKL